MSSTFATAIDDSTDLHEALMLARMAEWSNDLYLFSHECLGNNETTNEKLFGNREPRVALYTRWVGERVLDWLQNRATQKVRRKMMVLVPRECYKTTNITTTLPVWCQVHDPDISVVVDMAKKKGMADKVMSVVREHMVGSRPTSKLIETFGPFYNPKLKDTEDAIVGARRKDRARKDRTVAGTSVDIGATGDHPDLWIWDDPVTRELANDTWYATCWDHYVGTFPIVRTDGMFILIMTRYGEGDPCGRIIDEEIAPKVVEKYGELPSDFRKTWHKYAHLADWDVWFDTARDVDDPSKKHYPSIWTDERMHEYESTSPGEFAAQCMNMPGERKDQPLQREHVDRLWIDFQDVDPSVFNNIYIHMDLAWKDARAFKAGTGDYSTIQTWGIASDNRSYYLPYAYRGRDMQEQFRSQFVGIIQQIMRRRGTLRLMTIDKSTGGLGTMVTDWFHEVCMQEFGRTWPILELSRGGATALSKDDRCMVASRYWIDDTVRLVRAAPHVNVLVDEMLGIGVTRYDDMRDAAADHFNDKVRRNPRMSQGFVPGVQPDAPWRDYFEGDEGWDNDDIIAKPGVRYQHAFMEGLNVGGGYFG